MGNQNPMLLITRLTNRADTLERSRLLIWRLSPGKIKNGSEAFAVLCEHNNT